MSSILTEMINQSEALKRLDAQETFILDITEQIWEQLETKAMTKKELAAKLEKSPAWVTQFLSGSQHLSLRALADIAYALDLTPTLILSKKVSP